MILSKIKSLFGFGRKGPSKEIIVSVEALEKRVALLEGGTLEEFGIERESGVSISGNVYKGRVHNIEPALKALFIDIGVEKNAFLHYWDAMPAALDKGVEVVHRKGRKAKRKKITNEDIPNLYPPGSDIVVQVTKGPIGTKGARITTNISLAGKYVVLMPYSEQSGISRKIEDPKERQRLRQILNDLDLPDGMGVIIRTAGIGMKARYFVRDIAILLNQWDEVERKMKSDKAPALLLKEPDIVEQTVRDFLTDEIDAIAVDDLDTYNRVKDLVGQISRRSERKVIHYTDHQPVFEKYNVTKQIDAAFRRMVWLKSGAYLVIDETEALVSIDVNTGRNKGGDDQGNTIRNTNVEAGEEIARQLRLRNIGGLIVIDFIDMRNPKDQRMVYQSFKEALKRDKAKTSVLPISQLGLMEMTRQRLQESINRSVFMECPSCKGKGFVKTAESMSVEIQREIHRLMVKNAEIHEVRVTVHPQVLDRLRKEDEKLLVELERRHEGRLSFRPDPRFHFEEFTITNALNDEELK